MSARKASPKRKRPALKEFNFESYGTEARVCALADAFELDLIRRRASSICAGDIQDKISDGDIDLDDQILPAAVEDEPSLERVAPVAEAATAEVMAMLGERQSILGDRYPFSLDSGVLTLKTNHSSHHAYLVLLAVAWGHTVGIRTPNVQVLFEELVERSLRCRDLAAYGLRNGKGFRGSFHKRLSYIAKALNMHANPCGASSKRHANDAGVDVVASFSWGDDRTGCWWLLGQATCGRAETWEKKLNEPKPAKWAKWMGEYQDPSRFLAVPHHVSSRKLKMLCEAKEGFVLDRLRLAAALTNTSNEDGKLIELMRKQA